MNSEEFFQHLYMIRNIETPCKRCGGPGVFTYSDTSTWRGGVGGQTLTVDVCNHCWGSGDENRKWPSHEILTTNER